MVKKLSKVRRCTYFDTLIGDRKKLVGDAALHWKPVQFGENWRDMVVLFGPHNHFCSCILDCLQALDVFLGKTERRQLQ